MKYSGYIKKDLIEVINNLEHNYNCQRERADNQFETLKNMQAQIVLLEYTLAKAKRALTYSKNIACETLKEIDETLAASKIRAKTPVNNKMQATLNQIAEHGGFNLKLKEE